MYHLRKLYNDTPTHLSHEERCNVAFLRYYMYLYVTRVITLDEWNVLVRRLLGLDIDNT